MKWRLKCVICGSETKNEADHCERCFFLELKKLIPSIKFLRQDGAETESPDEAIKIKGLKYGSAGSTFKEVYNETVGYVRKLEPRIKTGGVWNIIALSVIATYFHETFGRTVATLLTELKYILSFLPEKELSIPLADRAYKLLAFEIGGE